MPLDSSDIPDEQIEAGAKALRERMTAGRITHPWEKLLMSAKRKWRDHAACVLTAARTQGKGEG